MKLGRWVACVALVLSCALPAMGQGYPNKTVHLIVPFTAGSATDILARTFGQKLSEMWGQPVIVENRPGAGGTIGAAVVAKSPPDGYTLLVHSAAQAYNASIYPTLPYDTTKDFVEIAPLAGQPNVLIVAPATGVKTVAELIALAKQKPGQLNFGSAGTGSGTHINAEKFKLAAGIDVVHIPYKGTPEALNDTLAGRVTYFFSPISAALPNIREGKLLALGVSTVEAFECTAQRADDCRGRVAGIRLQPVGGHVRARRNAARHRRQDQQGRRSRGAVTGRSSERFANLGAEAMPMTPAEFRKFVQAEIDDSAKVIKAAGIKAQ